MAGATYDAGALLAAERNDRSFWALHAELLDDGVVPAIPAPVLAQSWRGGSRQALLSRLLASSEVEDLTEERARAVGALCGRSAHDDIVDVSVVESALRRGNMVVTTDAADITRISQAVGARMAVVQV